MQGFLRYKHLLAFDLALKFKLIACAERELADQKFVEEAPDCPPVDVLVIPTSHDDLWCHVAWRADHRELEFLLFRALREAKVYYLQIPILSDEYILLFEVAVHEFPRVQIADSENDLRSIELDDFLWKALLQLEDLV